jgi:hypothetical protein
MARRSAASTRSTTPPKKRGTVASTPMSTTTTAGRGKKTSVASTATKKSTSASSKKTPVVNKKIPEPDFEEEDEDVLSEEIDGEDDEYDDEDDEYEILYLVDADKTATTAALRLNYAAIFLLGAMHVVAGLVDRPSVFGPWTAALERETKIAWGAMQVTIALLLIAAAQTSYDGQKKALQYLMIGHILMLIPGLVYLARPDARKTSEMVKAIYTQLLAVLTLFGVTLYAVYFYVQKELGDELGDDEDDGEGDDE